MCNRSAIPFACLNMSLLSKTVRASNRHLSQPRVGSYTNYVLALDLLSDQSDNQDDVTDELLVCSVTVASFRHDNDTNACVIK